MKIKEIIKNENYIPSNPTSNTPSQSALKKSKAPAITSQKQTDEKPTCVDWGSTAKGIRKSSQE